MIRIITSITLLILLYQLKAQDDNLDKELYSQDTVFILLDQDVKSTTYGKDILDTKKKYPEDKNRYYFLDNDLISLNTFYTNIDLGKPFYFWESKEKFHKRASIYSSEFAKKREDDALASVQNRVLMMVDPTFSDSINYCIVRVFRYAGER